MTSAAMLEFCTWVSSLPCATTGSQPDLCACPWTLHSISSRFYLHSLVTSGSRVKADTQDHLMNPPTVSKEQVWDHLMKLNGPKSVGSHGMNPEGTGWCTCQTSLHHLHVMVIKVTGEWKKRGNITPIFKTWKMEDMGS